MMDKKQAGIYKNIKSKIDLLLEFCSFLLPYWKKEVVLVVLSFFSMALSVVLPYLSKIIIDDAYANKNFGLFISILGVGAVIFIVNTVLSVFSKYLSSYIKLKVDFDFKRKFFRKAEVLQLSFFQNSKTGQHIQKVLSDISSVSGFIVGFIPNILELCSKALVIIGIVFYLNWHLALLAFFLLPLVYISPYYFTKKLRKIMVDIIVVSENMYSAIYKIFTKMTLIKTFAKERDETNSYLKRLIKNIRLNIKMDYTQALSEGINQLSQKIITGLIVLYGGFSIIKGNMSLGEFTAIMIYLTQLIALNGGVASFFQSTAISFISCERVKEFFAISLGLENKNNLVSFNFSQANIGFNNISFSYGDKNIISNCSFSIPAKSKVVFVGESGCGKTTIIYLLLGLFKANLGEIYLGDSKIDSINLSSLRKNIAVTWQESFLFNDTIYNNVSYAHPERDKDVVVNACKLACIDSVINNLSKKYDSIIGEEGCKLSQGQKQRVAIARALLKKSKIIVFDEATSAVDVNTEEKIIKNIKKEFCDSTIIMVSHRESVIKMMDTVYFMKSPCEIIIGKHMDLLEQEQAYRKILGKE